VGKIIQKPSENYRLVQALALLYPWQPNTIKGIERKKKRTEKEKD